MPRDPRPVLLRYGFATLLTILAILLRVAISSLLGGGAPFILFFPTVTLSAWYGGLGAGLFATFFSALLADFIYFEPVYSLLINSLADATRLMLFIGGGSFISWICGSLREANLRANELIKLQKKTAEADAKLAAIVESSDDAIIGKTLDGIITSWNRGAEKIYGYTAAEIIGQPISTIAPPERYDEMRQILEKLRRGENVENSDTVRVRKGGRRIDIALTISPIKDTDGQIIGASTIARDITEQKQRDRAEKFLAESSTTLASSLDYETTLATIAKLAVPHFADWCGIDMVIGDGEVSRLAVAHIDPEKVVWARELQERYPPNPSEPHGIYNVLRTGQSEFYPEIPDELLIQTARDEEHLKVMRQIGISSAMIVPLKARGKTLGVITFVNSESVRHHTPEDLALAEDLANRAALAVDNARLYQVEQQTRLAAERTSDRLLRLQAVTTALSQSLTPQQVATAVIEQGMKPLHAQAGTVVSLNESGTELEIVATLGFPPEVTDKWLRFPLSAEVAIADAVREKRPILIESFAEWSDRYPTLGPLASLHGFHALIAYPLIAKERTIGALAFSFQETQKFTDDDRAFMLALAQQCAQALERARLYETERRLRTEAEEANRIKDEFLATVSHELRTPLTAIVGWSGMLRISKLDAETTARAIETIERNAKAQTQIIEDLLDVSRIITGKLRLEANPIRLDPVITTALDAIRHMAETKGIQIKSQIEQHTGTVMGDPARLQQVMWNLLTNAVKFNSEGGSIAVRVQRVDSHVQIIVSDTGQGISREFLPFVFERFRQADGTITRSHGGLGLGLSIVRHLVEIHGGTVRAESAGMGKGATFTVELPLRTSEAGDIRPEQFAQSITDAATLEGDAVTAPCTPALENFRVLVVDDEADARVLLTTMIEECGAKVRAVASTPEALEAMNSFQPDVLVSGIGIPGEDGYSLIRKVRALKPEEGGKIPAIALTAYAREEDRMRALLAGYQVHIAKPVNPTELLSVLGGLARIERAGLKM
jgi:PAS domain S-box-containing protein